jgi:hypothetical protein
MVLRRQTADDRERLLEPGDPMVVRDPNARYSRSFQPAPRPRISRPPEMASTVAAWFGKHRRRMKARRRDQWPKLDTLGVSGKRGKRGPRLPRPLRDAAGQVVQQMVTKPKRVEPDALRSPGHQEQLRPFDAPLDLGQLDTDAARTRHPRTLPAHTPTRSLRPWQATELSAFAADGAVLMLADVS